MPFETIDQGILALREQAQQTCNPEGGAVYVPLMGKYFPASEAATDLDAMIQAFTAVTNPKRTCVLLGDGGSGKSFFLQQLTLKLWHEYESGKPIPLFVSLPLLQNPIHSAVEETLLKTGFNRVQIEALKQHHSFIFIFDGYDELHQLQNLYVSNRLSEWNAKTIISCRSQYLYNKDQPDLYFMPIENEREQPHLLQKIHVAPFNEAQIEEYLAIMLSRGTSVTGYTEMVAIPGLHALVTTPFLLTLTVEALPEILTRYASSSESVEERHRLTQTDLYKSFVRRWFERQEIKLTASGHITADMPDQKPIFWSYCQALALEMHQHNLSWLHADDERFAVYFDNDPETEMLRSACPIKKTENRIGFWHESLSIHFVTQTIRQESLTENSVQEHSLSSTIDSTMVENTEQKRPQGTIHVRLITDDPAALRNLADEVEEDPRYKAYLFDIIKCSKTNAYYAVGAANAISALNAARTNFSGMDLQGIHIPYANLTGAFLSNSNLSRSNLTNVNFNNAMLLHASLQEANLTNTKFLAGSSFVLSKSLVYAFSLHPIRINTVAYDEEHDVLLTHLPDGYVEKRLVGHTSVVQSIVFSIDGRILASGSWDTTIRLWDIAKSDEESCINILTGHDDRIQCLVFAPDGTLVSGSRDNTIRLWNTRRFSEESCIKILIGHTSTVSCLVFSSSGKLFSASCDGTIRLWDTQKTGDESCLKIFRRHTDAILSLAIAPDGTLASGCFDTTICLWNPEKPVEESYINTFTGHAKSITCLAFSPDGTLASGSRDNTIRLWNTHKPAEKSCIKILRGHTHHVQSIVFMSDGNIASGSFDKTIRIWDIQQLVNELYTNHMNIVSGFTFSPDGKFLAVGSDHTICGNDNFIYLWNVQKPRSTCIKTFTGEKDADVASSLVFSPDGKFLASGGIDHDIYLWSIQESNKNPIKTFEGHIDWVLCLAFSPNGQFLASGGKDKTIRLWDIYNSSGKSCIKIFREHEDTVRALVFMPNGHLISGSFDGTVRFWNIQTLSCIKFFQADSSIISLALALDSTLALGCRDNTISLLDTQKSQQYACTAVLTEHTNYVHSLAFTPDMRWLISASNKEVFLWNLNNLRIPPLQLALSINRFSLYGYILSVSHSSSIYTLDLSNFPRKLDWGVVGACTLWLEGCNVFNATGVNPTTQYMLKNEGAIDELVNLSSLQQTYISPTFFIRHNTAVSSSEDQEVSNEPGTCATTEDQENSNESGTCATCCAMVCCCPCIVLVEALTCCGFFSSSRRNSLAEGSSETINSLRESLQIER